MNGKLKVMHAWTVSILNGEKQSHGYLDFGIDCSLKECTVRYVFGHFAFVVKQINNTNMGF